MKKAKRHTGASTKRFCAAACALLVFALAGCGGSAGDNKNTGQTAASSTAEMATPAATEDGGYYEYDKAAEPETAVSEEAAADVAAGAAAGPTGGADVTMPQDARKVIMRGYLEMESTAFEKTGDGIRQAVEKAGGYIQSSELITNYGPGGEQMARYTARVPAGDYSGFADAVAALGNVRSRNESSEDVTSQFVDIEARLESLRAQEKWLLNFMEEAKKVEDMLEIERQISDVQYQIESYTASLNQLSQLTSYSTLEITLYEVKVLSDTPTVQETYGQRASRAFSQSWTDVGEFFGDLGIFLIGALPVLIFLAAVAVVVILVVRRARKRMKKDAAVFTAPAMPNAAAQTGAPAQAQPPAAAETGETQPPQN